MIIRALITILACSILSAAPKAIWVWEAETLRLMDDRGFETQVVSLLRSHGFQTLYLYADRYRDRNPIQKEKDAYRSLISRLHKSGLKVEALLGSFPLKTWEYVLPELDGPARAMMQHVLDYNAESKAQERFDGIHLDIEPYALDAWNDATRASISRMFLERSRQWVGMARQASRGIRIGAAIPFWYDGFEVEWQGVKKPMNAHVQDIYDYVAIMDYRNHADGPDSIVSHAQDEMVYGSAHGKMVVLGLETGEAEMAKLTFRHLGADALVKEMAATERAFARSSAFSGFAIHHLRTWMELIGKTTPTPSPNQQP